MAKEDIIQAKCHLTEQENLFRDYTSDRGLVSRIHKELRNRTFKNLIAQLQ